MFPEEMLDNMLDVGTTKDVMFVGSMVLFGGSEVRESVIVKLVLGMEASREDETVVPMTTEPVAIGLGDEKVVSKSEVGKSLGAVVLVNSLSELVKLLLIDAKPSPSVVWVLTMVDSDEGFPKTEINGELDNTDGPEVDVFGVKSVLVADKERDKVDNAGTVIDEEISVAPAAVDDEDWTLDMLESPIIEVGRTVASAEDESSPEVPLLLELVRGLGIVVRNDVGSPVLVKLSVTAKDELGMGLEDTVETPLSGTELKAEVKSVGTLEPVLMLGVLVRIDDVPSSVSLVICGRAVNVFSSPPVDVTSCVVVPILPLEEDRRPDKVPESVNSAPEVGRSLLVSSDITDDVSSPDLVAKVPSFVAVTEPSVSAVLGLPTLGVITESDKSDVKELVS